MSFIEDSPIFDKITPADMQRMNVGRRWWQCTVADIPDGLMYKAVLRKYLDKLADHIRNGRGLLFHGRFSTGKSGAAVIVAKAVVCHGGTAFFMPVSELSDQKIENRMFNEEMRTTIWDRMIGVDLLILDDLGAEHQSAWVTSLVERIIRLRSNRQRALVYTTNLFDSLKTTYGESIFEIIRATALPVYVDGKNWRNDETTHLKREILGE